MFVHSSIFHHTATPNTVIPSAALSYTATGSENLTTARALYSPRCVANVGIDFIYYTAIRSKLSCHAV